METQYTKEFNIIHGLCRKANYVYNMTTKFWGAIDGQSSAEGINAVCCGIHVMKNRTGIIDGEDYVMSLKLKYTLNPFNVSIVEHNVHSVDESKARFKLLEILEDSETLFIKDKFNSQTLLHNKILLCPMNSSIDSDVQQYLEISPEELANNIKDEELQIKRMQTIARAISPKRVVPRKLVLEAEEQLVGLEDAMIEIENIDDEFFNI